MNAAADPRPVSTSVRRDAGHPWDGRPGFDLLSIDADTEADRDRAVAAAEQKHWRVWICGFNSKEGGSTPGALLYKPSGIMADWHDHPGDPHPGCREGVELPRQRASSERTPS